MEKSDFVRPPCKFTNKCLSYFTWQNTDTILFSFFFTIYRLARHEESIIVGSLTLNISDNHFNRALQQQITERPPYNLEPRVLRLLSQRWVTGDPPLTKEPENSGLVIDRHIDCSGAQTLFDRGIFIYQLSRAGREWGVGEGRESWEGSCTKLTTESTKSSGNKWTKI